jgi:hypothetical protein
MSSTPQLQTIEVPASLDLVERAKLGINGLLGTVDPDVDYECYFLSFLASRPQYMVHWSSMPSGVMPKYLEALALLRTMSGSAHLREIEHGMVEAILANIAEDGLIYDRKTPRRPWNVGVGYGKKEWDEDYSCLAGDGRLVCGMDFYYQLTGDEMWKRQMRRTSERMLELAVVKEDYAYYPNVGLGNDFSWPRESGWTHTNEPEGPFEGQEGATTFYLAQPIRGWTRWYKHSGDERMLDISRRFARFVMQSKFWGGKVEAQPEYGRLRAHWHGHFHGTLAALRGVLEYALAANDYRALEFVRDGYEWARQHFCPQLGCDANTEGCAIGDIAALAIQLSDAGAGDFWDDVDCLARNALPEVQFTDDAGLRLLGETAKEKSKHGGGDPLPGQECTERVVERNLGAVSHSVIGGRVQEPMMMSCCTANANQAFYYAWEAIVRHDSGQAVINLLLSRFSPWLDIASYLPFQGKVVIKNKTARRISVRIPPWVPRRALRCAVDGRPAVPDWIGRCAQFTGLRGGEVLTLEFPLKKETLNLALSSVNGADVVKLRAEFKGSTCLSTVSVDENFVEPVGCKLFNRPEYQADQAPMRNVHHRVVQKPIRWY